MCYVKYLLLGCAIVFVGLIALLAINTGNLSLITAERCDEIQERVEACCRICKDE